MDEPHRVSHNMYMNTCSSDWFNYYWDSQCPFLFCFQIFLVFILNWNDQERCETLMWCFTTTYSNTLSFFLMSSNFSCKRCTIMFGYTRIYWYLIGFRYDSCKYTSSILDLGRLDSGIRHGGESLDLYIVVAILIPSKLIEKYMLTSLKVCI